MVLLKSSFVEMKLEFGYSCFISYRMKGYSDLLCLNSKCIGQASLGHLMKELHSCSEFFKEYLSYIAYIFIWKIDEPSRNFLLQTAIVFTLGLSLQYMDRYFQKWWIWFFLTCLLQFHSCPKDRFLASSCWYLCCTKPLI